MFTVAQKDSTMTVREFVETATSNVLAALVPTLPTVSLVNAIKQLKDYASLSVHLTTLLTLRVSACLIKVDVHLKLLLL